MENQINYYRIDRAEWRNFYKDHIVPLTNEELDHIKSLNDRISMEDVSEVYMPMVHLLQMFMKNHQRLQDDQARARLPLARARRRVCSNRSCPRSIRTKRFS